MAPKLRSVAQNEWAKHPLDIAANGFSWKIDFKEIMKCLDYSILPIPDSTQNQLDIDD